MLPRRFANLDVEICTADVLIIPAATIEEMKMTDHPRCLTAEDAEALREFVAHLVDIRIRELLPETRPRSAGRYDDVPTSKATIHPFQPRE